MINFVPMLAVVNATNDSTTSEKANLAAAELIKTHNLSDEDVHKLIAALTGKDED